MKRRSVVFDLDGTVIDSMSTVLEAINAAFTLYGIGKIDATLLGEFAGAPLEDIILQRAPDASRKEAVVRGVREAFADFYSRFSPKLTKPFRDARPTLAWLKRRGFGLALYTMTPRRPALRELEKFGLLRYFEALVTAEDVARPKPHPEGILKALERLGADASAACFVGDSPLDVRAGKAAGVRTIAVATGLCTAERLKAENPFALIGRLSGLKPILSGPSER